MKLGVLGQLLGYVSELECLDPVRGFFCVLSATNDQREESA